MKAIRYISTILLGVVFLFSSSGFLVYKTLCACSGNEKITVFVKNEICSAGLQNEKTVNDLSCCFHEKQEITGCSMCEGNECHSHSDNCECDSPELIYVKLNNPINNEEVKFTHVKTLKLFSFLPEFSLQSYEIDVDSEVEVYIDPPPVIRTSLDFLIQIHQLKIPSQA